MLFNLLFNQISRFHFEFLICEASAYGHLWLARSPSECTRAFDWRRECTARTDLSVVWDMTKRGIEQPELPRIVRRVR